MIRTDRALLVTPSTGTSGEYLHVDVRAMRLDDGSPRNLFPDDYDRDPLAGLAMSAQANRDPGEYDRGEITYAHRIGLTTELGPAPLAAILPTVATLRRLDAQLTKRSALYGPAATFGGLVARVADALRLPVLTYTAKPSGAYTDATFRTYTDPAAIIAAVDAYAARFRARLDLYGADG